MQTIHLVCAKCALRVYVHPRATKNHSLATAAVYTKMFARMFKTVIETWMTDSKV